MGHTKRRHNNPQLKSRTTRSSRGRLLSLSDPAQTSRQLDDQLRALGLYAAPTIGDGNCLFRALSDQLYGTDSKHAKLRQDICDWIEKHKSRYEPFVDDERGIDTHLSCMRENATYGGHVELSAFAHMAKRNVKVVQPGLVYVIEWDSFGPPSPSSLSSLSSSPHLPDKDILVPDQETDYSTIYVAYHDWEHFSSIRNLKGPHAGPPKVKESSAPAQDPSPIPQVEQYVPAKERKKAERDKAKERKERKKEKAREKYKMPTSPTESNAVILGKGKERQDDENEDDYEDVETEHEAEPDVEEATTKLKIRLKLNTLSNNSSSTNINEIDEGGRPASSNGPQRTGLKLRLPPSRSLSTTPAPPSMSIPTQPDFALTPPVSRASTVSNSTSVISESSLTSVPDTREDTPATTITSIVSTKSVTSTSTTSNNPSSTIHSDDTLVQSIDPTTQPSTSSSSSAIQSALGRMNRSPKRTFEESECGKDESIHPDRVGVNADSGGLRVKARVCGPERGGGSRGQDHHVDDVEMEDLGSDREVKEVEEALGNAADVEDANGDSDLDEDNENSDMKSASRSQSLSPSRSPSLRPSRPPDGDHQPSQSQSQSRPSSTISSSRKSRKHVQNSMNGYLGRPMTRRQRKALGLPRTRSGKQYGVPSVEAHGHESARSNTEEEWLKNGTGRVDVRGFRELKI